MATYTLYHLDRPVERFDTRFPAVNALTRAISGTANQLKGFGYSKEERGTPHGTRTVD